jgi:hypothetical protein
LHRIYHQSFFLLAIFLSYFHSESVFSLQPLILPLSASPSFLCLLCLCCLCL